MPAGTSPPKFIDQLRARSEAVRAQDRQSTRPVEEALAYMDRRMWAAFRWLDEAVQHLEVIRPAVAHTTFAIPGVLALADLAYDRGFVSFRRRTMGSLDVIEYIQLFYRLSHPKPVIVRVQPGAAANVEERLRAAHLPFRYDTEQDAQRVVRTGVFTVTAHITSSVRFVPDYRRQRVEVSLRNVDRFEPVTLDFPSTALDEGALEDLVHLILGEGNQFLRRAPLAGVTNRTADLPPGRSSRQYAV